MTDRDFHIPTPEEIEQKNVSKIEVASSGTRKFFSKISLRRRSKWRVASPEVISDRIEAPSTPRANQRALNETVTGPDLGKSVKPPRLEHGTEPARPRRKKKIVVSDQVKADAGASSDPATDDVEWTPKWPSGLSMEEIARRIGPVQQYGDDLD